LRQLVLTAERTVTRAGDVKKVLTAELRLENGPFGARGQIGDAASVGCAHVSGLLVRQLWPLALMKSADRFPISLSRTRRLRHCGL